jgi:hypothetical protein
MPIDEYAEALRTSIREYVLGPRWTPQIRPGVDTVSPEVNDGRQGITCHNKCPAYPESPMLKHLKDLRGHVRVWRSLKAPLADVFPALPTLPVAPAFPTFPAIPALPAIPAFPRACAASFSSAPPSSPVSRAPGVDIETDDFRPPSQGAENAHCADAWWQTGSQPGPFGSLVW